MVTVYLLTILWMDKARFAQHNSSTSFSEPLQLEQVILMAYNTVHMQSFQGTRDKYEIFR